MSEVQILSPRPHHTYSCHRLPCRGRPSDAYRQCVDKPSGEFGSEPFGPSTDFFKSPRRLFRRGVQQGCSERRGEAYSLPYVEPLSDARTPLASFINSLLDKRLPCCHVRHDSFESMTGQFMRLKQTHSSFEKRSLAIEGTSWQVATLHDEDGMIIPPSPSFLSD